MRLSLVIPWNGDVRLKHVMDWAEIASLSNEIEVLVVDNRSANFAAPESSTLPDEVTARRIQGRSEGGPGIARNLGLTEARGRYVAFVDSDDHVDLKLLQLCLEQTERDHLDVALTDYWVGTKAGKRFVQHRALFTNPILDAIQINPAIWRCIFRRAWLLNARSHFPDLTYAEDLIMLLQLAEEPSAAAWVRPGYYTYSDADDGGRLSRRVIPAQEVRRVMLHLDALRTEASSHELRKSIENWRLRIWLRNLRRTSMTQLPAYLFTVGIPREGVTFPTLLRMRRASRRGATQET
jgi:glycosyltransferase involved in cell wall biosynthesis